MVAQVVIDAEMVDWITVVIALGGLALVVWNNTLESAIMVQQSSVTDRSSSQGQLDDSMKGDGGVAAAIEVPQRQIAIDDARTLVCYAKFCRVAGAPEELILNFGLNSQSANVSDKIEIAQRLILNLDAAKRLLIAIALSVQRHEHSFGLLETDVPPLPNAANAFASVRRRGPYTN